MDEDEVELSSGSDFDDDEDPDEIEVPGKSYFLYFLRKSLTFARVFQYGRPTIQQISTKLWPRQHFKIFFFAFNLGGGKDLATAMVFGSKNQANKGQNSTGSSIVTSTATLPTATTTTAGRSLPQKLPSGIVTKPNSMGYDVIKPNMAQGIF